MPQIVAILFAVALVSVGVYYWRDMQNDSWDKPVEIIAAEHGASADYKDAEYLLSGERVKLKDGIGETDFTLGASSKTTVRYFGNEVRTDLDGNGREDVVFLLTQETGGSATYYYAVAALSTPAGYVGSEAVLLGDRIAPQTTQLGANGLIIVNYADRAPGEPMTAQPSVGKSIWLKFDATDMRFGEVVQNFEGETR